jgi:aconitate hydratase 2/2-methylisocitrate dehydratase
MGDGAIVHLGSAELAAITALSGKIPAANEYFDIFKKKIIPKREEIYRYLQFDEMDNLSLDY